MRILVTGSRKWRNAETVKHELLSALEFLPAIDFINDPPVLVHGTSEGVDTIAARVWAALEWPVEAHPPKAKHNRAEDFRNQEMVNMGADLCVAFIRNDSACATRCVKAAEEAGIPVRIYRENTED